MHVMQFHAPIPMMYGCEFGGGPNSVPSQMHGKNDTTARGELALWVGNIPANATIMRLRDYFSDAMPTPYDLLSISYNPDARYAFVNFRTEPARMLAINQAASRLLERKRLDCRIRRAGSNRSMKVNYGLHAGIPGQPISTSCDEPNNLRHKVEELSHFPEADSRQYGKEKYFILKSYSLENLYRSLETGQWHIPNRHVERLNHAFQTASKVFLFFSVNGSGCFFGYATMRSEIRVDEQLTSGSNNVHQLKRPFETEDCASTETDSDVQSNSRSRTGSCISSDSSTSCGTISYEPERRRIIWQALAPQNRVERCSSPCTTSPDNRRPSLWSFPDSFPDPDSTSSLSKVTHFSSPCQIKWLSTQSIPFDDVRGLRNAWNSNKEIHIARNVTAVEPIAGAILLRLWKQKREAERSMYARS